MPVLTTCLAVLPALATASQDTRSHEPGVVVRLYDIGVGVRYIPELAPGQLPNVVKVLDTIELRTDRGDFAPLKDNFMTEVIADLKIEKPGTHRFRLISDDGSRLWIDDKLIIDYDGLHGPDPKDGNVELTAGAHTLRILHFESAGGEHLELRWCQPGAVDDKFTLIPAAVLTHDAAVSRETSPGTKKIIPPLRRGRPGDGTPVHGPHAGFVCDPDGFLLPAWSIEVVGLRVYGGLPKRDMTQPFWAWIIGFDESAHIGAAHLAGETYADQFVLMNGVEKKRLWIDRFGKWPERYGESSQGCIFRFEKSDLFPNTPTGRRVFEMLVVRGMANGFEIEFTKPLDPRCGWEADSYYIEQWPFSVGSDEATERRSDEGGTEPEAQARVSPPQRDGVRYPVKSASVSTDRKKVFLEIENLKESHVVYIRLLPPCVSEDGDLPWSTEAWYTLNAIPKDPFGKVLQPPAKGPQNFLTAEERTAGWRLLFDGKTTTGWRGYKKDHFPNQGWKVIDDCIVRVGPGGGDICTVQQFGNFELKLEWRICAGGNSGIFYRVDEQYGWPWESGPEMQVLDNAEHADGRNPKTSAGSNYALHAPVRDVTEPVGFFNQVRIVADGPHVEYWLNDVKIVEYELKSPEWEQLVAESKFRDMPHHGRIKKGHIVLQDHGDKVWYRNIEIRRLRGE